MTAQLVLIGARAEPTATRYFPSLMAPRSATGVAPDGGNMREDVHEDDDA